MLEEVRKEGVAEGGQPGKEGAYGGSKESSASVSVSVSIFIPTVLGSSLGSVASFLPLSMVCQGIIHLAPTPAVQVPSPHIYWELARSRILRS